MHANPNGSGFPLSVPGCAVLITLHNPREKFWGALLELSGAGIVIRGIDLNSFDDFAAMAKAASRFPPRPSSSRYCGLRS